MMMGASCRCSFVAEITITVKRTSSISGRPLQLLGVAIIDRLGGS
jgi:hypothetical protein